MYILGGLKAIESLIVYLKNFFVISFFVEFLRSFELIGHNFRVERWIFQYFYIFYIRGAYFENSRNVVVVCRGGTWIFGGNRPRMHPRSFID